MSKPQDRVHFLVGISILCAVAGCSDQAPARPADYGDETIVKIKTQAMCDPPSPHREHEKRIHDVWSVTYMNKRTGMLLGIVAIGLDTTLEGCDVTSASICMITQTYRNDIHIGTNHDMGVEEAVGDQRKVHALFDTSIVGPQDIGRTHFATAPQLSTSWELWRSSSSIEVTHELQSQARFFPRWPGNDLAILPSQDDRPNNFDDLLEQGVQ